MGARGLPPRLLLAIGLLGGCALDDGGYDIGTVARASKVSDHLDSGCSTSVVLGLSLQISDEIQCLEPDAFTRFEEGNGIVFAGSAVLPYLTPQGKADLIAAVQARGGELRINSAFRTLAQQYLLRAWFERGRCDITAAAPTGESNHESGRAIDVGNWGDWIGALGDKNWGHTVPGDEVHFDHLPSPDLRGYDVLAFQRLWNRNHPDDQIDEDGQYGPITGERLANSPAEGFATGACGEQAPWDGKLVASDIPTVLHPGERADVIVRVENTGAETWRPGATFLGTSGPMDRESELHDPGSWVSPIRPASVAVETPTGQVGEFHFSILAPEEDERMLNESFRLVEDGVSWFGPMSIDLEILVSSSTPRDEGDIDGGCQAGGTGSGPALLVLFGLLALRRRRT